MPIAHAFPGMPGQNQPGRAQGRSPEPCARRPDPSAGESPLPALAYALENRHDAESTCETTTKGIVNETTIETIPRRLADSPSPTSWGFVYNAWVDSPAATYAL